MRVTSCDGKGAKLGSAQRPRAAVRAARSASAAVPHRGGRRRGPKRARRLARASLAAATHARHPYRRWRPRDRSGPVQAQAFPAAASCRRRARSARRDSHHLPRLPPGAARARRRAAACTRRARRRRSPCRDREACKLPGPSRRTAVPLQRCEHKAGHYGHEHHGKPPELAPRQNGRHHERLMKS